MFDVLGLEPLPEEGYRALLSQHAAEPLRRRRRVEQSRASLNELIAEYTDPQSDEDGLRPAERELLCRLSAGATDEAAASSTGSVLAHRPSRHG